MPGLFDPLQAGAFHLPKRLILSPLNRCRASPGRMPNTLMRDDYVQRASAGLIISEATAIDPVGVGYPDTPGIWSAEQLAGWRVTTDAVHAAGGRMLLQLWHGDIFPSPPIWWRPCRSLRVRWPPTVMSACCAREDEAEDSIGPQRKDLFGGVWIGNEQRYQPGAEHLLRTGKADAVAFGRLFIAHPDLPRRFLLQAPLNTRTRQASIRRARWLIPTTRRWMAPLPDNRPIKW